jgi:23S rRNA pseudouridine1911/1915/1917 synthase
VPPFRNYHIRGELIGSTLSGALKKLLTGETWRKVKSLVSGRHVQVNGNLCLDEGRRLTEKDVVKVWEQPLAKPVTAGDVRLLYVDDHLVVVEKPAGMTTLRHPEERHWPARRKQLQPTLDEALPRVLAKKLGIPVAEEERTNAPKGQSNRRLSPNSPECGPSTASTAIPAASWSLPALRRRSRPWSGCSASTRSRGPMSLSCMVR